MLAMDPDAPRNHPARESTSGAGTGRPAGPTDLSIRLLGPEDSISDLTNFLHSAYADLAAEGLRYLATHQTEATTRHRIEGGECYLAFLDGRLAGTVTLHTAEYTKGCPWYERADVASFHQLAVDPGLRRRGIAAFMLDFIERRAAQSGAAEIACDTAEQAAHLIRLYESRGYRFVQYADWRPTTNYRSVVLSKRLV
jgi:GNAT superfamily N-acetyltransferase